MRALVFWPGLFLLVESTLSVTLEAPSMLDCVNAYGALRFEIFKYDSYSSFFRNNSKMINPEAGTYVGPEDIEEYVRVADDTSPFIENSDTVVNVPFFKSVDPTTGTCIFLTYQVRRQEMNAELAREATVLRAVLIQTTYQYDDNYISQIDLYYRTEYAEFFFGTVLNSDKIRNYICEVSETYCPDTNVGMSRSECVQGLRNLPVLTNGLIDGKDYGCRVLHSVFAKLNDKHCPHISFEPQEDVNGKTKCQVSEGLDPFELFEMSDIEDFHDFLDSPESKINSISGYKIISMPREMNKSLQLWINLCVPIGIILLVFVFVKENPPKEDSGESKTANALLANKARRLWIIGGTIFSTVFVSFGIAFATTWTVARRFPDWIPDDDDGVDLRDVYIGQPAGVSETVPHEALTDELFRVYAGALTWFTCMLSGFGLEVFMWYFFLQIWSKEKETVWRFSQFIFPLLVVSAIGFGVSRNFWGLPFVVFGLFKFGFPEILMYTYLGLFANTNKRILRIADLLNGVGTAIHHSAVVMIVNMCMVGVLRGTRYSFNCVLIGLMQHWVILLSYRHKRLYSAIVLVLEFYFEWSILSDFPQLYHMHWIGAATAGVVLVSHWIYLFAAILNGCSDASEGHEGVCSVHARGNQEIGKVAETQKEAGIQEPQFDDLVASEERASLTSTSE